MGTDMEAQKTEQIPQRAATDQDETHEAAMRIARERLERDRRLREAERHSRETVTHELHTSIGGQ
jgi:hypothetical protein